MSNEIVPYDVFQKAVGIAATKESVEGMPLEDAVREASDLGIDKTTFLDALAEVHSQGYEPSNHEVWTETIGSMAKYVSLALAVFNYPTARRIATDMENDPTQPKFISQENTDYLSMVEAIVGFTSIAGLSENHPALATLVTAALVIPNLVSGGLEYKRHIRNQLIQRNQQEYRDQLEAAPPESQ
ncbi:hypothetical protein ACFL1B_06240 [Nanoarchaeota archaeon]